MYLTCVILNRFSKNGKWFWLSNFFLYFGFPSEAAKIIKKGHSLLFLCISQLRPYLLYLSHNFSLFSLEIVAVH